MENTEEHILSEPEIKLVPANLGKRFINYITDVIIFSILISILLVAASPYYPLATKLMKQQPIELADQLVVSFLYGLYMSAVEALLKGKSFGKFITGTRAVDENGLPISAQTAFIRGLIRIIPFEQLSAVLLIPYSWHDRWSKSIVVDEAKSILPKN